MYYKLPLDKLPYLNVGCGKKYNPNWVNVDMVAAGPEVIEANLIRGIPFPDNTFKVVYHSQVLEHIPKENAPFFLRECFRVLKPGGVLRVVCPDLESIAREYLKYLEINLTKPTPESTANYDWMLLEMYDQTVRNRSGGAMAAYISSGTLVNKDFVLSRTGFIGKQILERIENPQPRSLQDEIRKPGFAKKAWRELKKRLEWALSGEKRRVGAFRLGGEVHMWMYDRYSLSRLLKEVGFSEVNLVNEHTSQIKDWADQQLDVRDGYVMDPNSLFMEAVK